jgi:hypothetical protein
MKNKWRVQVLFSSFVLLGSVLSSPESRLFWVHEFGLLIE